MTAVIWPRCRRRDTSPVGTLWQSTRSISLLTLAVSCLLATDSRAEIFSKDGFKIYGDFRARLEADWDSQTAGGSQRDDRTRTRIRARLGLDYAPGDYFTFGARLRSGSDASHQSPHITVVDFDGNDTGDADFNLDKWFLKVHGKKAWGWIGRNSLPFWKQNELFWDDDVTPVGLAFGYKTDADGKLELNGGYFSLPVGMRAFAGNLGVAQVVYAGKTFTVAGGLLDFDADPDDSDAALLLRGDGQRDYSIVVGNVQGRFELGGHDFTLAGDVMVNTEDYSASDPDPFTAANRDETDGYVAMVRYGSTREKGNWLVAWYYAHIETLAVNASYAEDDWLRWGSATETRASNFKGHELRFAYALGGGMNLVARLYVVEAVTNEEDGNRFRLDFNYKF